MLLLLALALVSLAPLGPAHPAHAASPTETLALRLADVTRVYGPGFSQATAIRPTRTSAQGWLPFPEPATASASSYVDGDVLLYSRGCTTPNAPACIVVISAVFRYKSASYVRRQLVRIRVAHQSHVQPVAGVGDEAVLLREKQASSGPTLLF